MDPYIMIWDIESTSTFSLTVTGGEPFSGQSATVPPTGTSINSGSHYDYVLFQTLNVDIWRGPNSTGQKLGNTTISMKSRPDTDPTKPPIQWAQDDNNILIFTYSPPPDSKYPGSAWDNRNYFKITAPSLQAGPPIITNEWSSGQGNTDSKATVGESFWVQDYGMDEVGRWTASSGAIFQSTEALSTYGGNAGSRAYPIHIKDGAPTWNVSEGVGVAFDGLWQIDIKIGSDGTSKCLFCETFYLAERADLTPGFTHYSDGSSDGGPAGHSREIDIMETKWNGSSTTETGPQVNLPNGGGTGWNPDKYQSTKMANWSDVGGAPTKDFITFGCLISGNNLWFYAYNGDKQWYCSEAIALNNSTYVQKSRFAPYIGTWGPVGTSGGFQTGYKNFIYLDKNDPKIAGKNPKDNPEAFGSVLK